MQAIHLLSQLFHVSLTNSCHNKNVTFICRCYRTCIRSIVNTQQRNGAALKTISTSWLIRDGYPVLSISMIRFRLLPDLAKVRGSTNPGQSKITKEDDRTSVLHRRIMPSFSFVFLFFSVRERLESVASPVAKIFFDR